jgi:cytochrome c-type biogenesis protein CcmH/NrfG
VGRQRDAVPVLAEAFRLDPLHAASASAYASALRAAGRVPEAEALWTDLIRRLPGRAAAVLQPGVLAQRPRATSTPSTAG